MSDELQQLADDVPAEDSQQTNETTGDDHGLRNEEEAPETPVTIEQRARAMGWRPKSEFRGDPAAFTDAAEFVRRADESLPLMRNELRRAQQKLVEQERILREQQESARQFAEFHRGVERQAYERARAELRRQRAEARNSFDVDRELQIEDELERLDQEQRQKYARQPVQQEQPQGSQPDPEIQRQTQEWQQRNEWVNDPEAQAIAIAVGQKLRANGEESVGAAFLEKVAHEVRKKYPQLFPAMQNARRDQAHAPTGGGDAPVRGRKKGYADLPADARAACDDFVKRGYLTKDDYVKQYFGE